MKRLIVLSGAGISAESGIKTFRDQNGLWENYRIEEVATPNAWLKDPSLVIRFYNERRQQLLECKPNKAHFFFKEIEKLFEITHVTQNIDDLFERAGCSKIIHLHGELRKAKSSGPNQEKEYFPIKGWELNMTDKCPDGFLLRPHVVWFGEDVPLLELAAEAISQADVLIVIGTSLQVYPAANLIHYATNASLKIIIDPNADQLSVPKDFILINKNATESIEDLKKLLR